MSKLVCGLLSFLPSFQQLFPLHIHSVPNIFKHGFYTRIVSFGWENMAQKETKGMSKKLRKVSPQTIWHFLHILKGNKAGGGGHGDRFWGINKLVRIIKCTWYFLMLSNFISGQKAQNGANDVQKETWHSWAQLIWYTENGTKGHLSIVCFRRDESVT